MSQHTKSDGCHRFTFQMCDDVAEIVFDLQRRELTDKGYFRGRNQIINRIIREWNYSQRALNDAGTDALETGNT